MSQANTTTAVHVHPAAPRSLAAIVATFTLTIFLSSALLLVVQPMVGKMILPLFGGTPAVWNTCMVFYQVGLLLGYAYAHASTRLLGIRWQAALHAGLMLAGLLALPMTVPVQWVPPAPAHPAAWVLLVLLVTCGVPFVVVSASSPLLQRWFARTSHPRAHDPYFLYAASNLGSMLALLSYPVLIEPTLTVARQRWSWTIGYGALIAMIGCCSAIVFRAPRDTRPAQVVFTLSPAPAWSTRLLWIALAFVPSSYLLGVTSHITADVAAVPLLWVIPLALYLLSFIFVFARRQVLPHRLMVMLMPYAVLAAVVLLLMQRQTPAVVVLGIHLFSLFIVSMVCHGELARRRPPADRLTEFYLLMSVGGALGGAFNALLAPLIFPDVWEYPLAMTLACLLYPGQTRSQALQDGPRSWRDSLALALDVIVPAVLLIVTWAGFILLAIRPVDQWLVLLVMLVPTFAAFMNRRRPIRFGVCVGAILAGLITAQNSAPAVRMTRRSFFGVHRVVMVGRGGDYAFDELSHGTTVHGRQVIDRKTLEPILPELPLAYYDPSGPMGDIFAELKSAVGAHRVRDIAVVGLGTGNLISYADPGINFTYYEIDPVVPWVAEQSGFFTYLPAARKRGVNVNLVMGDARLTLAGQCQDRSLDVLILDAFSGDSIPIHLMTRQALENYRRKMKPGGWIIVHVSNKFLELRPVVAALAADAGWQCIVRDDTHVTPEQYANGKERSTWVVLAQHTADYGDLPSRPGWQPLPAPPHGRPWTDDFSNIISVFKWR